MTFLPTSIRGDGGGSAENEKECAISNPVNIANGRCRGRSADRHIFMFRILVEIMMLTPKTGNRRERTLTQATREKKA
jgi:hypothetical protein